MWSNLFCGTATVSADCYLSTHVRYLWRLLLLARPHTHIYPINKGSIGGLVICCFVDFVLVSALPGSTGTTTNKRLRTWPRPNQVVIPFAGFAQVAVLKNKTLISTAYAPEWTLRKRSSAGHCVEPVANRTERAIEATRSEHRECIQRKKRKQFGAENDKTGG